VYLTKSVHNTELLLTFSLFMLAVAIDFFFYCWYPLCCKQIGPDFGFVCFKL